MQHPPLLSNQIALVTGGSQGYGLGIARELVRAGARVFITARHTERLEKAAAETGALPITADATRAEDWERVLEIIATKAGTPDILINNAGAGVRIAPVEEQSVEEIRQALEVNLFASILGARAVIPGMKARGRGTIIQISSICERNSWPGWAVYGAAKAGLRQFSEGLHTEVRSHGIRVTTLVPSWGLTSFQNAAALDEFDPATAARVTKPEELGAVVVHLCSLPDHLVALDMTLLPLVQEIVPL